MLPRAETAGAAFETTICEMRRWRVGSSAQNGGVSIDVIAVDGASLLAARRMVSASITIDSTSP